MFKEHGKHLSFFFPSIQIYRKNVRISFQFHHYGLWFYQHSSDCDNVPPKIRLFTIVSARHSAMQYTPPSGDIKQTPQLLNPEA